VVMAVKLWPRGVFGVVAAADVVVGLLLVVVVLVVGAVAARRWTPSSSAGGGFAGGLGSAWLAHPGRWLLRRRLLSHVVSPGDAASSATSPPAQAQAAPKALGPLSMSETVWAAMAPPARMVENLAERALRQHGAFAGLRDHVARSGLGIGPAEVVGTSVVVVVAGVLIALVSGLPPLVGLGLCVAGGCAPLVVVGVLAARRRRQFAAGLPDLLTLLAGTLRAGFALSQAVAAVSDDLGGPVSQEFRRLAAEVDLGRPLPAALRAVARRMDSDEVEWVAVAVEIHQQAGGNLAEVLDIVAITITERQRLHREIATLTAEGRISAVVLGILPPALAVVISVLNPGYLGSLVAEPIGVVLAIGSGVAMVVGFVWMHHIVGIEP